MSCHGVQVVIAILFVLMTVCMTPVLYLNFQGQSASKQASTESPRLPCCGTDITRACHVRAGNNGHALEAAQIDPQHFASLTLYVHRQP